LVFDDPNPSRAKRQRIVTWFLWVVSGSLVCLAIFASVKAGCGATVGRDTALLAAAMVTGLATAVALLRPMRAWQALVLSLAVAVAVGGGLVVLGELVWVHDCAN
jgi:uncharacterized membrane protein